jgi:hypothetical protein
MQRFSRILLYFIFISILIMGCDRNAANKFKVYEGKINYAGRHFNRGPFLTDSHSMTARIIQSGSEIIGTWKIIAKGKVVTHGFFEKTIISDDKIKGILNDNGSRFDAPFYFSGELNDKILKADGTLSWCGDWKTDFNLILSE